MTTLTKRATIYLEPDLHKALRLQALETSRSMSELVNEAIRDELAEDAADFSAFDSRKNEPTVEYDAFVKGLKRNGII